MMPFGLSPLELFIVGFGGIVIDLDHVIYQYFIAKNKTLKEMFEWHKKENAVHRPHFYIFHMIEFIIAFIIISFFINRLVFLFALGFGLHFLGDFILYILYYKSLSWMKYFSLAYKMINFFTKKFINKSNLVKIRRNNYGKCIN
jgi:hypothetical protein